MEKRITALINKLVTAFRADLLDTSPTARAIDQGAPRLRICAVAREEGYVAFANKLRAYITASQEARAANGRRPLNIDGFSPIETPVVSFEWTFIK